ncbi:metallophosphoesterase family protein [Cytophaga aurantiaca]|uniref:metallophosphoesterase family protein n=1 Tax=Cytophaga aurantiaca TaxID=29530 RepID=UPI00035F4235|nr:metallophosphoesterase family protein [Cytophaga aurantiaca]
MKRTFVIADIHGCIKSLKALIENQLQPTSEDQFIFLGDYIDRGPDSRAVINYLIDIKNSYRNCVFLRGNHEQMFIDAQNSMQAHNRWILSGGEQVMISHGLKNHDHVPFHFQEFIINTSYYFQDERYIFVHAGLNHLAELPLKDYNAMMWIREFHVTKQLTGGRILIHGHTPTTLDIIKLQVATADTQLEICLDNGCVFKGQREGMGNLLALELKTNTLFIQNNIDF